MSVVTGQNGAGKSRILSAVASLFDDRSARTRQLGPVKIIEFTVDEQLCVVRWAGAEYVLTIDGQVTPFEGLPQPSITVASTASAFDKFPLSVDPLIAKNPFPVGRYKYLGLRDSRGRVSGTTGVYRAVAEVFDASAADFEHRNRVRRVFSYLGLSPAVQVEYRWTVAGKRLLNASLNMADGEELYRLLEQDRNLAGASRAMNKLIHSESNQLEELVDAIRSIKRRSDSESDLVIEADLGRPENESGERYRSLQLLRRAELLQVSAIYVGDAETGERFDLKDASSGQLSLATSLLGVSSAIRDGGLVLIDEPEISLHPGWQNEYMTQLGFLFGDFHGCHFIIATHSPQIVSGVLEEQSTVISMDRPETANNDLSGRSADVVLLEAFGVAGNSNLHLRELLVDALRGAEDGNLQEPGFDDLMAVLEAALESLSTDSQVRQLIEQLLRTRRTLANAELR
jgi:predicted ATPase